MKIEEMPFVFVVIIGMIVAYCVGVTTYAFVKTKELSDYVDSVKSVKLKEMEDSLISESYDKGYRSGYYEGLETGINKCE